MQSLAHPSHCKASWTLFASKKNAFTLTNSVKVIASFVSSLFFQHAYPQTHNKLAICSTFDGGGSPYNFEKLTFLRWLYSRTSQLLRFSCLRIPLTLITREINDIYNVICPRDERDVSLALSAFHSGIPFPRDFNLNYLTLYDYFKIFYTREK